MDGNRNPHHDRFGGRQAAGPAGRPDMHSAVDPAFEEALLRACGSFGLLLTSHQIGLMWRHLTLARDANQRFNLTRIVESRRAAVEHYADSLTLLRWLTHQDAWPRRALDVGTGGGWPAVPLAVLLPEVCWTAIDSTGKKARFVAEAAGALGLRNLVAVHARAVEFRAPPFDLVVARAAGRLPEVVREAARLVAPGGCLVSYKTAHLNEDERRAGIEAAKAAGLSILPEFPVVLHGDETYHRRLVPYRRPR